MIADSVRSFFGIVKNYFTAGSISGLLSGRKKFPVLTAAVFLALIYSVSPSLSFYFQVYPTAKHITRTVLDSFKTSVPTGTVVTIKNGTVSTNLPEPFYITADRSVIREITSGNFVRQDSGTSKIRFLTIDTKASADDFENYQTLYLLTRNSLVSYSDDHISISPLRNIENLTITSSNITRALSDLENNRLLQSAIGVFLFLIPVYLFIFNIFTVLFSFLIISVLILGLTSFINAKYPFRSIYYFSAAISLPVLTLLGIISIFWRTPAVLSLGIILSIAYLFLDHHRKSGQL